MTVEFYSVNSPLVNYFFYKAPFISDSYVLTNFTIQNGGSGYAVNDILVAAGGVYTNPVVLRVQSVSSGVITGAIITNAGQYTNNPTSLTVGYTNGSGTGAVFNNLIFAANLLPPGPNIPLSGGFLFFYADEDHTLQLPTYSDISDPSNPVVNTNPIQLGAAGDCGIFYLQNRLYYIVITDYTGDQANPQWTISHYNPADNNADVSAFNENFIVNPQFNYPIEFWKTTDQEGEITQPNTVVAWGWEFIEDADTETQNFVTFEDISGQQIEGSPVRQVLLTCTEASSAESLKDFRQLFGTVDFNSGNNVTFCNQMVSELGNINVELLLELNYGEQGSQSQLISLTTFTVTPNRQKFVYSFQIPTIEGFSVEDNNYVAIRIRPALFQTCQFGMTNVLMLPGTVVFPKFFDEPKSFAKSQIIGNSTNLFGAGLYENYSSYYYNGGDIFPYADTGTMVVEPNTTTQPFRELCDASTRFVNGYSPNEIPYRRLYNVIGNTFGGAGELAASSKDNIVTASSVVGAREHSTWTKGTTSFTVTKAMNGLRYGLNLTLVGNLLVNGEFVDFYAPDETAPGLDPSAFVDSGNGLLTYWGTRDFAIPPDNITFVTTNTGSPTTNATFTMTFASNDPTSYITNNIKGVTASFIEFAQVSDNNRSPGILNPTTVLVNTLFTFSLDGYFSGLPGVSGEFIIEPLNFPNPSNYYSIQFFRNVSMQQNIRNFIRQIANPFEWTITVTTAPTGGQYLLFSSSTTDYYGWFTVNGAGTDPAVPDRTGVEIATFSGQTTTQIAEIIAEKLNTLVFNLPAQTDICALGPNVSWYINL